MGFIMSVQMIQTFSNSVIIIQEEHEELAEDYNCILRILCLLEFHYSGECLFSGQGLELLYFLIRRVLRIQKETWGFWCREEKKKGGKERY